MYFRKILLKNEEMITALLSSTLLQSKIKLFDTRRGEHGQMRGSLTQVKPPRKKNMHKTETKHA